uniref:Peptidyl-prolyl isomerase n=1 Tax=uncultured marine thaumarchaeote AD1000_18_B11 TaxID=1455896 RepID=A0A075FR59_9ARCH|nr:hypothetical protein [uncultured marine thaumarchaeote AD1000_18_B11]
MSKFLIILLLLAGSSLFAVEAFALEVEIQKEADRIIESKGWLTPEIHTFQEQFQIIIDEVNSKTRISIGMLSTHPNDIKFPDEIEALSSDPRIFSITFTNKFACSPTHIDRGCVIVEIVREGLGDSLEEIKKNSREIADESIGDSIFVFSAEFDSVEIQPRKSFDGKENLIISKVLYTTNKQTTSDLFLALSSMLISGDIREAGGFYDNAEVLSKHHFSEFTVSLVPLDNNALRTVQISLTCSSEDPVLPRCPNNFDKLLASSEINPLEIIGVENIYRSKIFEDKFLPLNSIVQILIFSDHDMQVKTVNSSIIEKLEHIGNVQENGWFFTSKSGEKIDARYIFAAESSASKNDLTFSIGDNTADDIMIKNTEEGGGCLIATAAFGSELSPQVQFLRELRDNTVLQTQSGISFMTGFNQFYYSFSPVVADYERENPAFKEAVKITLTPLLTSLTLLQYADIDSESEMLGYGIGIILLNIGMYFVAPAILIMKVKKRI